MRRRGRARGLACEELRGLITAYLEHALAPADRRRFDAHLDTCADCRGYVASFAQVVNALGALPGREPSDEALEALLGVFRTVTGDR
jgi:anti-sigma factor RsiW